MVKCNMKYLVSIFVILLIACNKENINKRYYKVEVIQTSEISCSLPVLDFAEDSISIRAFTKHNNVRYAVIDLPSEFNIQNNKLLVAVDILKPSEEFPCNTLGINYYHLKITSAKERY